MDALWDDLEATADWFLMQISILTPNEIEEGEEIVVKSDYSDSSYYLIIQTKYSNDFTLKIRLSDHDASPFRERDFGSADYAYEYATEEDFADAVARIKDRLPSILEKARLSRNTINLLAHNQ